ncbi:DsbA family protein [Streptomyces bacillaris]|uniref:DsbA family protein n=1 Tax=Streptomyces bacillaris TaxID=68179 RepID=UPI00384E76DC
MGPVHQSPCQFVGPGEPDARERLLHGYHTEGLDIASHEVLEKLGVDAGLEPSALRRMLEGTEFTENVRADERSAWKRGVRGVPTLVPDGGPPASVIQDPGVLDRLLTLRSHAWRHGGRAPTGLSPDRPGIPRPGRSGSTRSAAACSVSS